jgi:NAD(P)-dependent dehydrogenase (short-subunit alcohol dehydrogenase family)
VVNVTSREAVEHLARQAKGAFERIDMLANNAGIPRFEPFLEITDQNWDDTLAINLKGVFLCSQVVAAEMKNLILMKRHCAQAVRDAVGFMGAPLRDAVRMASETPAGDLEGT